jgi:hypothetical protein
VTSIVLPKKRSRGRSTSVQDLPSVGSPHVPSKRKRLLFEGRGGHEPPRRPPRGLHWRNRETATLRGLADCTSTMRHSAAHGLKHLEPNRERREPEPHDRRTQPPRGVPPNSPRSMSGPAQQLCNARSQEQKPSHIRGTQGQAPSKQTAGWARGRTSRTFPAPPRCEIVPAPHPLSVTPLPGEQLSALLQHARGVPKRGGAAVAAARLPAFAPPCAPGSAPHRVVNA